jgi:hypothetical protein
MVDQQGRDLVRTGRQEEVAADRDGLAAMLPGEGQYLPPFLCRRRRSGSCEQENQQNAQV